MKHSLHAFLVALVVAALAVSSVWAGDITSNPPNPHVMKGTILKYSQPLGHFTPLGTDPFYWGEDIPSDFDWYNVMHQTHAPGIPPLPPNWIIADDFRDPFDTPVVTVRWWGSYVGPTFHDPDGTGAAIPNPFGPGTEDGYVISFFRDIPVGPNNPDFSRPGELLGSYILPLEKVWVEHTGLVGYDQQELIFEYKANLMDAHLDHPTPWADQMGFHQKRDEVYWISISAFVGHKPELVTDPDGTVRWEFKETGKFALPEANPDGHFWGWHTSPEEFNDIATMGHLWMPDNQWIYDGWNPIQPRHHLLDMAFELYTVPEPASAGLLALAIVTMLGIRRRA